MSEGEIVKRAFLEDEQQDRRCHDSSTNAHEGAGEQDDDRANDHFDDGVADV